jgi:hypothetical protein
MISSWKAEVGQNQQQIGPFPQMRLRLSLFVRLTGSSPLYRCTRIWLDAASLKYETPANERRKKKMSSMTVARISQIRRGDTHEIDTVGQNRQMKRNKHAMEPQTIMSRNYLWLHFAIY